MAEGKLLMLLGDECKKQKDYTNLDKEYEIEVLLDAGTDTGDALGLAEYAHTETLPKLAELTRILREQVGTHERAYPAYSSKTVNGKPLFLYTLEGTLDEISIPTHPEHIYHIKLLSREQKSVAQVQSRMQELLAVVPRSDEPSKLLGADFRQDEIRTRWRATFANIPERQFTILKLRVTCGSGAYMRTLAQEIGKALGKQALALTIKRTRIGRYLALGPLGFWMKQY
jgi:tRNA pseudouridine(55) synthase